MSEVDFIDQVQSELNISGMLPSTLEEAEIRRIIFQAKRFFSENWEQAVTNVHYIIKRSEFNTADFKRDRIIKVPDCVISVLDVREMNGFGRLGNIDKDFAEDKLIASEIFLSSFHGDDLIQRIAQYQYYDLSKAMMLQSISYDHNRNTHEIKILGRDPKYDVYIKALATIPDDKMYNDYYFLRWCTAKAKVSLARLLGMYPMTTPGEVQPNADMLRTEGESEIEWLLERFDSEQPADFIIMFHVFPWTIIVGLILSILAFLSGVPNV